MLSQARKFPLRLHLLEAKKSEICSLLLGNNSEIIITKRVIKTYESLMTLMK